MLRGASSGYTIIELMIVLAISVVILATAAFTISGTNGKTQFTQSMRDVNSKLLSWFGDVSNGFPGGRNTNYYCALVSNKPQINTGTNPSPSPDCVFIGKVIQFTPSSVACPGACAANQPGKLYAYSVFGQRTISGSTDLADNITDATPVPAVGNGNSYAHSGSADLTDIYTLSGGTTVKSIKATTSAGSNLSNSLLGITQSFNATASQSNVSQTNGSQDLYVYSNLNANSPPGDTNGGQAVTDCIELATGGGCEPSVSQDLNQWPPALSSLQVCFASGYNSQTALITISSASGLGIQTKLEFIACT